MKVVFTFGSDEKFPFRYGYVLVTAVNYEKAIEIFNSIYPERTKGISNCAFIYHRPDEVRANLEGVNGPCHRVIDTECGGMTLRELLELKQDDYDTFDTYFSGVVTCCHIDKDEFKENISDKSADKYYYLFCKYIYDNVFVSDFAFNTCDWTGFIQRHEEPLKQFMSEYWDTQYDNDCDFICEWIKEIHLWLAGYTTESSYAELLNIFEKHGFNNDSKKYKNRTVYVLTETIVLSDGIRYTDVIRVSDDIEYIKNLMSNKVKEDQYKLFNEFGVLEKTKTDVHIETDSKYDTRLNMFDITPIEGVFKKELIF